MLPLPLSEATRSVLLLDGDGDRIAKMKDALHPMFVTAVTRVSDARERLAERRVDAVLMSPHVDRVDEVIGFLVGVSEEPKPPAIAFVAELADLPILIRQKMHEFQVLSLSAAPTEFRRAVMRLAGSAEGYMAAPGGAVGGEAVLLQTIRRALRVRDVVVRHQSEGPAGELELVLPLTEATLEFHRGLQEVWGAPVVAVGQAQELFSCPLTEGSPAAAQVAYRPWSTGEKVTVRFGVTGETSTARRVLEAARTLALNELPRIFVPKVTISPGEAVVIAEYHWVATASYIGLDRRLKPPPLLSRFSLFGRRSRLPLGPVPIRGTVDGVPPALLRAFILYAFVAGIDVALLLALNLRGDRGGHNDLIRFMIFEQPVLMVLLRHGLALAGFWAAGRFAMRRSSRR